MRHSHLSRFSIELHFGNNTANCTSGVTGGDLLTLQWAYTSVQQTGNNGNVQSQIITTPELALTQNYTYDGVNRLKTFSEGSIGQTYGYDAFGNRWVEPGSYRPNISTPSVQSNFVSGSNRLAAAGYDGSGNTLTAPGTPFTFAYDGDNRTMSAVSSSNGSASYAYDAEGRRVKKITCSGNQACTAASPGAQTTLFVYDAMGQLAAEYGGSAAVGIQYYTSDHLGSTRLVTDASGTVQERLDYLPFGEGLGRDLSGGINGRSAAYPLYNGGAYPAVPTDALSVKFTSKARDAETGLDYFGARYMSSAQGRFTSPDPGPYLVPSPQSWNRYSYVLNNPLRYNDPSGRVLEIVGESSVELIAFLEDASGLTLVRDKKGHLKQQGKRKKEGTNAELAKQIGRAISSAKTIKITANQGQTPYYNYFDDASSHTVDMSDFSRTRAQAPALATALLDHVISEYVEMAEGLDFFDAHQKALKSERKAMSAITGQNEKLVQHLDDANPVMKFVYTTVQYEVLLKQGPNGTTDIDTVKKIDTGEKAKTP